MDEPRQLSIRTWKAVDATINMQPSDGDASVFRDCQEWEWIPRRFRSESLPASACQCEVAHRSRPHILADDVWAKLVLGRLNLQESDLPITGLQPSLLTPLCLFGLSRSYGCLQVCDPMRSSACEWDRSGGSSNQDRAGGKQT